MSSHVASAQAVAVADYRERFNQAKARASSIHEKIAGLRLDQQGKEFVYHRIEEVTRQTQKGLAMISEVEDVLTKVGPSKKKDRSTAMALRAAQGKLVKAISYRQHQADQAVRLAYKAVINAQEDTVRRNKAGGIKTTMTTGIVISTRRENKGSTLCRLRCDNLIEPYTNEGVLEQVSTIIQEAIEIPLVGARFSISAEQAQMVTGTETVTESEYKLASHLAVTQKTNSKTEVPCGMSKALLRLENIDDYVLLNSNTGSKDSQTSALVADAISDANVDTDVCARTVIVPDHYSKVSTSFVGDITAGDIMAMTSGVYSDVSTIMRQAVELWQFETDAKIRCGRHMHQGLEEVWKVMRAVVDDEGQDNVVSALRWIQITKWLSAQNNTSSGMTQVAVQSRMGHIIMKYSSSAASNLAEAITLTSPGLTYKTIKSVLAGLSVRAMSQNGVVINEVSVQVGAVAAVNKIEMILLRHVNGLAAIRWLRAYLLDRLDVCIKVTAPIQETSSYRATHKLKNRNVYESDVVVRMRRVHFDCSAKDLLVKACVEDGPIVRKAKYGRRNVFDECMAMRACVVPMDKIIYAIDELPTKGGVCIPVMGTAFVGFRPSSKPTRKTQDGSYSGGGGGYHGTTEDYRDAVDNAGCGDLDGGNYVECTPDMFDDYTGGV